MPSRPTFLVPSKKDKLKKPFAIQKFPNPGIALIAIPPAVPLAYASSLVPKYLKNDF